MMSNTMDASTQAWTALVNVLFIFECYHFITHGCVLFRIRLLPRKDLVRNRIYFLIDTATVFIVNFAVLGRMREIAFLQILQHLYYFFTWEKSDFSKKVVSWSSLEWQHLTGKVAVSTGMFEIMGTIFDWLIHLINAYMLAEWLKTTEVVMDIALVHVLIQFVMFNPRFAWSEPTSMPAWVAKRLQPLSQDLVPCTLGDKLLGQKKLDEDQLVQKLTNCPK